MLRASTHEVHQRLHLHSGFMAVRDGTIDLNAYQMLLARLYGFHLPFESMIESKAERSEWLAEDLTALRVSGAALAALPRCAELPRFETLASQLGALYVIEGSALGGRTLSKSLDPVLGFGVAEGRRYFIGRGAGTAISWNRFLTRLSNLAGDAKACEQMLAAAIKTFQVFEDWLNGWRAVSDV